MSLAGDSRASVAWHRALLLARALCLVLLVQACETVPTEEERPQACLDDETSAACLCAEAPGSADCICARTQGLDCVCARTPDSQLCADCPDRSATALTRDARRSIARGGWLEAEQRVRCALSKRPDDLKAQRILDQLDRRNSGYRGNLDARVTVPYTVLAGDRLGDIAQKCLGDPDRFVELAVLNSIEDPSRLRPGTELRIPTLKPCVDCEDLREDALRAEAQGDLEAAVTRISDGASLCRSDELIADDRTRLVELFTRSLHEQAEADLAAGDTARATTAWERILTLSPDDAKARFYLDQLKDGD